MGRRTDRDDWCGRLIDQTPTLTTGKSWASQDGEPAYERLPPRNAGCSRREDDSSRCQGLEMLLNAFDVDPSAAERSLELRHGELFALGLQVDLLVISAYAGNYEPVPGTLVERLQSSCGLDLTRLPRQLDLTGTPLGAWISPALDTLALPGQWPTGSNTRFRHLAVIESPAHPPAKDQSWPVFRQLFSLLALLPLQGIQCPVVGVPLLSAGNQGVDPQRLFPDLLDRCRDGFRHVPDLDRLIVFDRQAQALELLAAEIDAELGRFPSERDLLQFRDPGSLPPGLAQTLAGFPRRHPHIDAGSDLAELQHLLGGMETTAVALGFHGRRLVEQLVRQRLGWRRGSLYQGIQALSRQGLSPWIVSCLHQVRVFGNWMGHPSPPGQRRAVSLVDVSAMLSALQRVLEDYPW